MKIHFIALTLQETAAFAVVLLALGYIAWRLVRFVHRKGMPECRCCQSCSAESPKKVPVTLNATKVIIPDDPGRRGVVGIAVRNGRMLVIRRSRSVVAPLVYCFPGGGIEEGESEEEALVREFQEEIGITIRPLRRVWHCVTAWKVDLAWWLVDIPPEALPVATPAEVESIHWYTPAEMAQLPDLLESNREFLEFVEKSGLFSDTQ